MNIGTVLFTYNRPWHTELVIKALAQNTVLPQKLYIFQDGLKNESHYDGWKKVKEIINDVNFCPVERMESTENKGLAKSIIDGINYVLRDNDAVIVLEDDCVPAHGFIQFMEQSFHKYKQVDSVYSISGYAWPFENDFVEHDIWVSRRFSSWGWGTWKDRWQKYSRDSAILNKIYTDEEASIRLATWGNDLEMMLKDTINGFSDSWAVYWALIIIYYNGLCIAPKQSLIINIGCDNSGTNCPLTNKYDTVNFNAKNTIVDYPDKIEINEEVKNHFIDLLGSPLVKDSKEKKKKQAIVYGIGRYYKQNESKIAEEYSVVAIIDRSKKGFYAGIPIIKLEEVVGFQYDVILIMVYDMIEANKIKMEFERFIGINKKNIIIGRKEYGVIDSEKSNIVRCGECLK